MRFAHSFLALLVAASTVSATLTARQSLPSCAVPCIANANTSACPQGDDACLCNDQAFISSTTGCIESSCSGSDLASAEAYAQQLCLAVGVTLTSAPTGTPSSASSSASSPTASSKSGAPVTSTISILAGAVAALAFGAVL